MTAQQLINLALRDIDRIRSGQTPSTDESNDSFTTLNELLGSWSQEGLLVPTHAVTQFSLTAGTAGYTMGVGAVWVTAALPIKIKGAVASITGGFQHGLEVMPMGDFERSILNPLGEQAILPEKLGYDDAAPMRNVRLWPTPASSSAVVEVSYWTPLTQFAALSDVVSFALPAFEMAVRNELSMRLAVLYKVPITPAMVQNAQASKLALTRLDPAEVPEQQVQMPPPQMRPAA